MVKRALSGLRPNVASLRPNKINKGQTFQSVIQPQICSVCGISLHQYKLKPKPVLQRAEELCTKISLHVHANTKPGY